MILSLATWRITAFLVLEDGPWGIFVKFRRWVGVEVDINGNQVGMNAFAEMIACIWCTSVWVGLIAFIAWYFMPRAVMTLSVPFALSGGAIVVQEFLNGNR